MKAIHALPFPVSESNVLRARLVTGQRLYVSTEPRGIGPVSSLLLGVVPMIRVRVIIIMTVIKIQFVVIVRVHSILPLVKHNEETTL